MLDFQHKRKEATTINAEQQKRKTTVLQGQQRYIKGHTLFEFDLTSLEVRKAQYDKNYWTMDKYGVKKGVREVTIKPNCVYRQFLNKKNAVKWAKKNLKPFML